MSLQTAIQQLDNCLATYCRPMYNRLQPPLSNTEIEAYFNKWGISDADLAELFMWKNGIEKDVSLDRSFAYNYTGFGVIPSLQYINDEFESEKECPTWRPHVFPVVTSFTGDFLLLDTNIQNITCGMLLLQCPSFGNVGEFVVSYYDSVEKMILTVCECFEMGAFIYDEQEMELKENYSLVSSIAKKNNPLSEYWK